MSSVIIIPQLQQDGTSWTLPVFCTEEVGDDAGMLLATPRFELPLLDGGICTFPLTMMKIIQQNAIPVYW